MKTKKLISTALVIFVSVFAFIVLYGCWQNSKTPTSQTSNQTAGGSPQKRWYSMADVEKHNKSSDCWMIIDGKVCDVTDYITQHPAAPEVLIENCGKDASKAYATKGGEGRKHSSHADQLLNNFVIGLLKEEASSNKHKVNAG